MENKIMLIKDLELDGHVKSLLTRLGYNILYPPQYEAINKGVLEGESMLITTPTASGKTLIALLAAANVISKNLGKVVYLTPLRALASEKYKEFKVLESIEDGCKVTISTGDYDSSGEELSDSDVIVLTYEKMDSLFRHDARWIDDVALYVFDEVHMLGDRDRGSTIEIILTRALSRDAQIIALSATIENAAEISSWLRCKLVDTKWRPTRLLEGVYSHGMIYYNDGSKRSIQVSRYGAAVDIALDTVNDGAQVLIFVESRKKALSIAKQVAEALKSSSKGKDKSKSKDEGEGNMDRVSSYIKALLEYDESELARNLAGVMSNLAAFHHAGLSPHARSIVEDAFRDGTIKVLVATPTLAAGVNLPARRVVISSLTRYDYEQGCSSKINVNEYKQMCGRAGRPRYDDYGEAIIISNNVEEAFDQYIHAELEPIRSTLRDDRVLRRHILATIAMSGGMKERELYEFFSRTLLAEQYDSKYIIPKFNAALEYLTIEGMIESTDTLIATRFGRRVSMLYIDPESAVIMRSALTKIRRARRLTVGLLHVITECPDFYPRLQLRSKDIDEAIMLIDEHGNEFIDEVDESSISRSLLALYAWINEYSEKRLYESLSVEPGDMYRMIEVADWLLYAMHSIAALMNKRGILTDIDILRYRVRYGIKEELMPLVTLEGIGRARARALFDHGFHDVKSIADASIERLEEVKGIGHKVAESIKNQAMKMVYEDKKRLSS
jgi:helicase